MPKASRVAIVWAAAIAAGAALLCFASVVGFEFVYDDTWTLVNNDALRRPLGWLLRRMAAGDGLEAHIPDATRPGLVVSFWIERRLFGLLPRAYHFDSLVLYAALSGLAAVAAFAASRRIRVATIAALFFALSPVHAEVVAAVNYREDLLAALGVLGPFAWLFWPRARATPPERQLGIAALWFLGLCGKESAIALVPLVLWVALMRGGARTFYRRNEGTLFALAAALIVWLNWRAALLLRGDDVPRAAPMRFDDALLATARFEVRAVLDALVPFDWSPEYAKEGPADARWIVAATLVLAGLFALARNRRYRLAAVGVGIAALAALPACPLVGPVNARADRYLFLSVFGGGLSWGVLVDAAVRKWSPRGRIALVAAACVPFFVASRRAVEPWHDELSLWTAAVQRAPTSARAWTGLSRAHRLRGELVAAEAAVARALALDGGFVPARVTHVYTLLARGDAHAAESELQSLRNSGNGTFRGVARAARCAKLPSDAVRDCINAE